GRAGGGGGKGGPGPAGVGAGLRSLGGTGAGRGRGPWGGGSPVPGQGHRAGREVRRGVARKDQIIVGLDIGTTKTRAIVAEAREDGKAHVIGVGTSPSRGLRKGVVVNIESTVESTRRAVDEAEMKSGTQINSVYVGIAGSHIKGLNSE